MSLYLTPCLLDIELTNFSRLYAGMGKSVIKIDFTKFDYQLFILIGDNGTGKTSLMSCFHPFAYNAGTASNNDLIMDGKNGSKLLHVGYQDKVYYIQHYYTRKKDALSLRSYISEDGVELNETGLIGTFRDIVEEKLGVHENFLTLLFLGDSVKGFVEFTSGDRKKYATSIFQRLQVFTKYNKAASAYVRDIKTLLQDTSRKLEQFHGVEPDHLQSELTQWTMKLGDIDERLSTVIHKKGSVEEKIHADQSTIASFEEKQARLTELFGLIDVQKRKIGSIADEVVLRNRIDSVTEEIQSLQVRIATLDTAIKSDIEMQDLKRTSLREVNTNITRMQSHMDFEELTELKAQLETRIHQLGVAGTKRPPYTSKQLIATHVYLDELRGMCTDLLLEVRRKETIEEVLPKFQKDEMTLKMSTYHYEALLEEYETMKETQTSRGLLEKIRNITAKTDCESQEGCIYYKFYQRVSAILFDTEDTAMNTLTRKKEELASAEDAMKATHIIKKLYSYIKAHKEEFDVPKGVFNPDTFILEFLKTREVYNPDLLTSLIDLVERFEQYDCLVDRLEETTNRLNSIQDTKEIYESMKFQVTQLEKELTMVEQRLDVERSNLEFAQGELRQLEAEKAKLDTQLIAVVELSTTRLEIQVLKEELSHIEGTMSAVRTYQRQIEQLSREEAQLRTEQATARNNQQSIQTKLEQLLKLQDDRVSLMTRFKEAELIQEATSPTKGIPVKFLADYIRGPLLHEVNRLLRPVYNGRVEILIEDTVIDDKEFTIPYRVGNTKVWDISSASDGQKAIFSLAFSLAFSKLIKKENKWFYCIFLFDEKDAKLDSHSRGQFVAMITNFMADIKADQLFLISHNSMFEGFPVNVIMTSESNLSNMPQAQVLKLYEREELSS